MGGAGKSHHDLPHFSNSGDTMTRESGPKAAPKFSSPNSNSAKCTTFADQLEGDPSTAEAFGITECAAPLRRRKARRRISAYARCQLDGCHEDYRVVFGSPRRPQSGKGAGQ